MNETVGPNFMFFISLGKVSKLINKDLRRFQIIK